MYCEKCGKLNNDSAQYCVSCGNPLNFGESTQPNGANKAEPVSNGGNVYQFNQNANTTSNAPNIKMSFDKKKVAATIVTTISASIPSFWFPSKPFHNFFTSLAKSAK